MDIRVETHAEVRVHQSVRGCQEQQPSHLIRRRSAGVPRCARITSSPRVAATSTQTLPRYARKTSSLRVAATSNSNLAALCAENFESAGRRHVSSNFSALGAVNLESARRRYLNSNFAGAPSDYRMQCAKITRPH